VDAHGSLLPLTLTPVHAERPARRFVCQTQRNGQPCPAQIPGRRDVSASCRHPCRCSETKRERSAQSKSGRRSAGSRLRMRFAVRSPPRIGLAFPGSPIERTPLGVGLKPGRGASRYHPVLHLPRLSHLLWGPPLGDGTLFPRLASRISWNSVVSPLLAKRWSNNHMSSPNRGQGGRPFKPRSRAQPG
jgi:hypothetical protein